MIRNLKALLVAAFAVLAVGAIGASSASAHAAAKKFTNVEGGTTMYRTAEDGTKGTTTSHHVFDVPGNGAITCEAAQLEGETTLPEPTTLAGGGSFAGCKFLGQPATVNLEGCTFEFSPNGLVKVVCPAGKEIVFTAAGCTVKVKGGQEFAGAAKYSNVGGANPTMEVTIEVATGATVHSVASGAGCISTGTTTTGQYTTGNTLVWGFSGPARKSITVDF